MTTSETPIQAPAPTRVYFQNLDILRFLAAMMVVVAHGYGSLVGWFGYAPFMQGDHPRVQNKVWHYIDNLIGNFGFGVDVFFLISGFLITYLLLKEKEITGKISLKDFYIRRTLRIWPLYYFIIILGPWLVRWTHSTPAPNYLAQIFFVGNFAAIRTEDWIYPFAHYWSICVEEHFYLVWPFLVAFIPTKRLVAVFATILFASIAFRFYMFVTPGYNYYHFYLHTLSRIDVLAIGAMLAFFHWKKPFQVNIPGYVRMLMYVLLITLMCTDDIHSYDSEFNVTVKSYIYVGISTLAIGSFLFGQNNVLAPKKKNIFHYFGKVSYGIYMYHNVLIFIIIQKVMVPLGSTSHGLFTVVYLFLCLVIPVISYELIEKPFLKIKTRFEVIKTTR